MGFLDRSDDTVFPVAGVTYTVGAPTGDTRVVAIQLTDSLGNDIAVAAALPFYFSDNATGLDITGTGPSGTVDAGTDGDVLWVNEAKKSFQLQSEADGDIDLSVTDAGSNTWYLCAVLPDGTLAVSGAIAMT